jgi:hypothetical protein
MNFMRGVKARFVYVAFLDGIVEKRGWAVADESS